MTWVAKPWRMIAELKIRARQPGRKTVRDVGSINDMGCRTVEIDGGVKETGSTASLSNR